MNVESVARLGMASVNSLVISVDGPPQTSRLRSRLAGSEYTPSMFVTSVGFCPFLYKFLAGSILWIGDLPSLFNSTRKQASRYQSEPV